MMQPLEPGYLKVMRLHAGFWLIGLVPAFVLDRVLAENVDFYPTFGLPLLIALLLIYPVLIAPPRRFRAWGYERAADELRVAHGIWTEVETVVPLARVQHIDVAQGVLERRYGVCRLILHTAGTANNIVTLPGLTRATAEALRDDIRARIRDDAL
jgi:membrane protein YdbS with pleckstrin-like domain